MDTAQHNQALRSEYRALQQETEELKYEVRELKSELKRHHIDFADISELLDEFFAKKSSNYDEAVWYLKRIRNITG